MKHVALSVDTPRIHDAVAEISIPASRSQADHRRQFIERLTFHH